MRNPAPAPLESTKTLTLSAQLVSHSLAACFHTSAGVDFPYLLHKSGISLATLKTPGARIAVEKVVMLQRLCNGALNDEATGLLEKPLRLGHFHLMALCAVHAGALQQALQRCVDFFNLFENSFLLRIEVQQNQTLLRLEPIAGQQIVNNHAIDFLLCSIHRFIGWLGNHRIILNQVRLAFPAPEYRDEYRYMYYGAPVLFNQDVSCLSFESLYLKHPVVQNESTIESYIRRAPMDLYLPVIAGGKLTEAVRNRIQEMFTRSNLAPNMDLLAYEMQFNPQTLRRRLAEEGSSFHSIKTQVRRDIAIHLLGNSKFGIEEIAAKAGYSEPSPFIRAFKTWTGFTPLQFRKGLEV